MIDSHTAENLATDFEDMLKEWKLDKTRVSVTTDNAANIVSAMTKCQLTHLKCIAQAHTLNLGTQRALQVSSVSEACSKVRRIVTYFSTQHCGCQLTKKGFGSTRACTIETLKMDVADSVLVGFIGNSFISVHKIIVPCNRCA